MPDVVLLCCREHVEPVEATSNPFGDEDDGDSLPSEVSVPARVVYTYKAEEQDELSADAGSNLFNLTFLAQFDETSQR